MMNHSSARYNPSWTNKLYTHAASASPCSSEKLTYKPTSTSESNSTFQKPPPGPAAKEKPNNYGLISIIASVHVNASPHACTTEVKPNADNNRCENSTKQFVNSPMDDISQRIPNVTSCTENSSFPSHMGLDSAELSSDKKDTAVASNKVPHSSAAGSATFDLNTLKKNDGSPNRLPSTASEYSSLVNSKNVLYLSSSNEPSFNRILKPKAKPESGVDKFASRKSGKRNLEKEATLEPLNASEKSDSADSKEPEKLAKSTNKVFRQQGTQYQAISLPARVQTCYRTKNHSVACGIPTAEGVLYGHTAEGFDHEVACSPSSKTGEHWPSRIAYPKIHPHVSSHPLATDLKYVPKFPKSSKLSSDFQSYEKTLDDVNLISSSKIVCDDTRKNAPPVKSDSSVYQFPATKAISASTEVKTFYTSRLPVLKSSDAAKIAFTEIKQPAVKAPAAIVNSTAATLLPRPAIVNSVPAGSKPPSSCIVTSGPAKQSSSPPSSYLLYSNSETSSSPPSQHSSSTPSNEPKNTHLPEKIKTLEQNSVSNSSLANLPSHLISLLLKCHISSNPLRISPYKCIMTRHPIHQDLVESHLSQIIQSIKTNGFDEARSSASPIIGVIYSATESINTWTNNKATIYTSWNDHPLLYIINGAARMEAISHIAQLLQRSASLEAASNKTPTTPALTEADQKLLSICNKGIEIYILDGKCTTPWDIFLISTTLNSLDKESRKTNYFERTNQITLIAHEVAKRKHANATCREIAAEICLNPFLEFLREPLGLHTDMIPMVAITSATNASIIKTRETFPYLPAGFGVDLSAIQDQNLEILDVLIDMTTCVNSERIKYNAEPASNDNPPNSKMAHGHRAEGFLHAVAEDQLSNMFCDIITAQSGCNYDVLILRDMVSIVFGAIQECSRMFRSTIHDTKYNSGNLDLSATSKVSAAYWIERIVHEASPPKGILYGLWNFPAAALVTLFYIYFVNEKREFDKSRIQDSILKLGTILYRCIAELAYNLRLSKINLMTASIPIQIRVMEGISLLFRFALFESVQTELYPVHPYCIPIKSLSVHKTTYTHPVKLFTDIDELYQFLYSYWFQGLITVNREKMIAEIKASKTSFNQAPISQSTLASPTPPQPEPTSWAEARRAEVNETISKIKYELELGNMHKVKLKRNITGKKSNFDLVDIDIIDPTVLPMANTARSEFITLVYGVVSLLIERRHSMEISQNPAQSSTVRVLTLPANMVVLAAIKVALSFLSPHFDKLAPDLTNWTLTRVRLVLWIWKTSKDELTKKAEERWIELWKKNARDTKFPIRLKVCFVTGQKTTRQAPLKLTTNKLGEVILDVLPDVFESMTQHYNEKPDTPDDHVMREFFAKWLKSASESDLIFRVNSILASKVTSYDQANSPPSPSTLTDNKRLQGIPVYNLPAATNVVNRGATPENSSLRVPFPRTASTENSATAKKQKRGMSTAPRANAVDNDFADWLEGLSLSERVRLEYEEIPINEISKIGSIPVPSLARWRPPELANYGNGLRTPACKWRRTPTMPLSELDWNIVYTVLKLLRTRGIDVIASNLRKKIFFLNEFCDFNGSLKQRVNIEKEEILKNQKKNAANMFTDRIPDVNSIRAFLEYDLNDDLYL